MYNVMTRASKTNLHRRADITTLNSLELNRELSKKQSGEGSQSPEIMSSPKPTFAQPKPPRTNGREQRKAAQENQEDNTVMSDKYQNDFVNWQRAKFIQFDENLKKLKSGNPDPNYPLMEDYTCTPHPSIRDMKPFNMEEWWGKRLYEKVKDGN